MNAAHTAPPGEGSRRRRRMADRPIRAKLALLLVAPVTVVLCLSGVIAYGARSAAAGAEQARRLVALSLTAGQLAGQLQQERAAAALVLAKTSNDAMFGVFQQQSARSDAVAGQFITALGGVQPPAGLRPVLQRIGDQVTGLPLLREQVRSGRDATASVIVFRYRALIADLISYRAAMSQLGVDADTANDLRASATLSQAIEGLGLVQVGALPAIGADMLTAAEQQQIVANDAGFAQGLEAFRQLAPARWQIQLSAQTGSKTVVNGERLQALAVSTQPNTPLDLDTTPAAFATALGARMAQLHTLEGDLDTSIVRDVTAQRDRERRQLAMLGAGVLLALLVVAWFAWRMTRSLTRPLRELHSGATDLARHMLPGIVDELINGNPDQQAVAAAVDRAARALPVHGSDEVGRVAVAFNDVAATAARLAGQQAALRGLNTQIARTLAHRLQSVVNKVTASIDALEAKEQDPERLDLLFAADQQFTSTGRFVNNLLVIAGGRLRQSVDQPYSVPDVVKGAISRADGAAVRVRDVKVAGDCLIRPEAIDPIVHILTELLVNALHFSAPDSPVTVSSARLGDLLYLTVDDEGIGLPPSKLAEIQSNLATFDLATAARHMGVPVIGLLAADLGLQVTFRSRNPHGTSVEVVVPGKLLVDKPHPDFPIVRGRPTSPQAPEATPVLPSPPPAAPTAPAPAVPAPAAPALTEKTALLPIAGRPAPGFEQPPRLEIYNAVLHDNPYFHAAQPGDALPTVPPAWRAGHDAATAAERATTALATLPAGAEERTASGLPKRQPGQLAIPTPASTPTVTASPRSRAATRRGMAALTQTARRKSPSAATRPIG